MDYCHHGFIRDLCDICRLEIPNKAPIKLVDDLRHKDLIHPQVQIKDSLSRLNQSDLSINPLEVPGPIVPYSLDPSKRNITKKEGLLANDDIKLETEILDPKKKYLMKK